MDGVKRLDHLAADYFNCEDTKLNAVSTRKMMIAAVARARKLGHQVRQHSCALKRGRLQQVHSPAGARG